MVGVRGYLLRGSGYSLGDGLSFPQRTDDADTDGLLSARRKWTDTDDTETDNDQGMVRYNYPQAIPVFPYTHDNIAYLSRGAK